MRSLALALILLALPGCRTRPWELGELADGGGDGGPRPVDLARPPDLAAPDLTSIDLAAPDLVSTDLARPPWCVPGSELIYVIDQNRQLARFDPLARRFTDVGRVTCPAPPNDSAFSMAVQRDGTAWVVFDSGRLYRLDTRTLACAATPFDTQREGVGGPFGMGFTAETPGSMVEVLHIAADPRNGNSFLGRLDLQTFRVTQLAALDARAELTGAADGRLWAFFPEGPNARVAQIDRQSGREVSRIPVQIPGIVRPGFAFSHWGGEFWLFVYDDPGSTQVHRLRPDGTIAAVLLNTGRHIVGAGVSICAP